MSSVEIQEENFDSKMIFLLFCFYSNVHEYILYIYIIYIMHVVAYISLGIRSFLPYLFIVQKKTTFPTFPKKTRHLAISLGVASRFADYRV